MYCNSRFYGYDSQIGSGVDERVAALLLAMAPPTIAVLSLKLDFIDASFVSPSFTETSGSEHSLEMFRPLHTTRATTLLRSSEWACLRSLTLDTSMSEEHIQGVLEILQRFRSTRLRRAAVNMEFGSNIGGIYWSLQQRTPELRKLMADVERILLEFPEPHISFSPSSSPYSLKIRKSISWAVLP